MEFEKVDIKGLILFKPKLIYDNRGFFSETFRKDYFEKIIGNKVNFCQSNTSESTFGTIRGLHFQISPSSQSKLVSVSKGEILDVALDIRKNSSTYGKFYSVILNENNNFQLYIPQGFAHGFSVLSKKATGFEILEHLVSPFPLLKNLNCKRLFVTVPLSLWFSIN